MCTNGKERRATGNGESGRKHDRGESGGLKGSEHGVVDQEDEGRGYMRMMGSVTSVAESRVRAELGFTSGPGRRQGWTGVGRLTATDGAKR